MKLRVCRSQPKGNNIDKAAYNIEQNTDFQLLVGIIEEFLYLFVFLIPQSTY